MIADYKKKYKKFGYSPKALGWDKGKQNLRFHALTHRFELNGCSILDLGCGFGDFNAYLKKTGISDYKYLGVDIVDDFIAEANSRYACDNICFLQDDILSYNSSEPFDYVISSGVFNHIFIDCYQGGGYAFIWECMVKAFSICNVALSFDFLSDKVDYRLEHTFHSAPEKILNMAYGLSRNIVFDNSYFPFEFCITIYKDNGFCKERTVFERVERDLQLFVEY